MKSKFKKWSLTAASLAIALPLLGGCAEQPIIGAPSQQQTASLKGRPFVVGQVTVSPRVTPGAGNSQSCLPDNDYADMLRYELNTAFKHAGLERGQGPAIPVNVTVLHENFSTNLGGLTGTRMQVQVSFAGHTLKNGLGGVSGPGWFNEGPRWARQQRMMPGMASMITHSIKSVQDGRSYSHGYGFYQRDIGGWVSPGHKTFGMIYPMSQHEMEQATGRTATQLAAVCKADMK